MLINNKYKILNSSNDFVDFLGVSKSNKKNGYKVTLENNYSIVVSEDHIFLANGRNMFVNSLIPNKTYLTTKDGDYFVKSIEEVDGYDFFDIVDSGGCEYYANKFLNHNCSFLGSGDNFIAEKYLKRIEEHEIKPPIKQEYIDLNMWIWEDPEEGEEYYLSIDSSSGHGEDYSTINIFRTEETITDSLVKKGEKTKKIKVRKTKSFQVAEYYGKQAPQQLAELAYQYGKKYNNAYIICDVTGGYGVQVLERLFDMGYDNIHHSEVTHKPTRDRLQGYIKQGNKTLADGNVVVVDLIPGFFIGNNRASVLLEMQSAIHNEAVVIRSRRLSTELKTFVTVPGNRVADHRRSFHDDSIMGMATFLYVLAYDKERYKQSKITTEKMLNSMLTNNEVDEMIRRRPEHKPFLRNSNIDPNNPYYVNKWLFAGLDRK